MSKKILLTATVQSHIAQFHKPLINLLKDNGYEVHIAAKNNLKEKNGLIIENADKIYDIPFSRSPKSFDNIKACKQLKKIIEENKYDIIHCNTPMGGIITRLAARKSRKNGTKVFYTAHGFHFYNGASLKNWMVFYPVEKLFARYTDKLITIVKEDYKLAKNKFHTNVYYMHGVGVDPNRYHSVSDEEKLILRDELGFNQDECICLCTGELNKNKNQTFVINVFSEVVKVCPNVKLLLAGNGPNEENLKSQVKELGLEKNVIFLGYTTKLEQYVKISDIIISMSFREGLPLNIIEGMLCNKPIIASSNRGHRELIDNDETGYILETFDVEKCKLKLTNLIENEEKRKLFGRNGKIKAQEYTVQSVREELERIYF